MAKGNPNPVSRKGIPNRVTSDARKAIQMFVDGNAHRLEGWLTKVAEGDPANNIPPNPAKAFDMFQSVVEYHIPKLARTELAGDEKNPLRVEHNSALLSEFLQNMRLNKKLQD